MSQSQARPSEAVATLTLELRQDSYGALVWSVDGHEGPTAETVLADAGRRLDHGVASIPGYGWGDR